MSRSIYSIYYIPFFLTLFFVMTEMNNCLAATTQYPEANAVILEQKSLPNQLGTYRHIQLTDKNIQLHAVTLDKKYRSKIYRQMTENQSQAHSIRHISQKEKYDIGINGGFYTTRFHPAGLLIQDGKTIAKLAKDPLLSSCIRADKDEKLFLEKQPKDCLHALNAMQTGPLLIREGEISKNITVLEKKLTSIKAYFEPHRRTLLAQSSDQKLIIIVTSPVTLSDMAAILKNHPALFGIDHIAMALNLDGGSSTGMYIKLSKRPFYFQEKKYVKTLLLFN